MAPAGEGLRVGLISLGCPKNLVDSEVLLARLAEAGLTLTAILDEADVVVVNTCAFIQDAREEALATLREMAGRRRAGRLKGVVAVGCLPQRLGASLARELPGVDAFLPISDYSGLPRLLRRVAAGEAAGEPSCGGLAKGPESDLDRLLLTPSSYAYLRISEGCDHRCGFCAIPAIRGPLRSKPPAVLREEARRLAALGAKELVLVAEDSTAYGRDLPAPRPDLAGLLGELAGVAGIRWLRVMYGHPAGVTDRLLRALRDLPAAVPYLDLPVQHASEAVLAAMGRGPAGRRLEDLLGRIRAEVPGIALRTSILVGHPGETAAAFAELLGFLERVRFERLGCFVFSPEEGTPAAALPDRPEAAEAAARRDRVMRLQAGIAAAWHRSLVGRELEVIIDGTLRPGDHAGRTRADAPDVDGRVRVRSRTPLAPGEILPVRITAARGYDLEGRPAAGRRG